MSCCHCKRTGEVLDEQCARLERLKREKAGRVLDFVGEALAHLTNADNIDIPADVRCARAVRVLSELVTRIEQKDASPRVQTGNHQYLWCNARRSPKGVVV